MLEQLKNVTDFVSVIYQLNSITNGLLITGIFYIILIFVLLFSMRTIEPKRALFIVSVVGLFLSLMLTFSGILHINHVYIMVSLTIITGIVNVF